MVLFVRGGGREFSAIRWSCLSITVTNLGDGVLVSRPFAMLVQPIYDQVLLTAEELSFWFGVAALISATRAC